MPGADLMEDLALTTSAVSDDVALADLAEDRANVRVLKSGAKVLVFRRGTEIKVFGEVCPHMGADLSEGSYCAKTGALTCRWHGYRFDSRDGRFVENPNEGPMALLRTPSKHYRPDKQPNYRLKPVAFQVRGGRLHFARKCEP
jgi:nitrite reductase/ring-hydroxylating ferredoxin subunit